MKRVLLDTSVLVAALVEVHPHHRKALPWLVRAHRREIELYVAAHSLAECFSSLTNLPIRPPIGPDRAQKLIQHDILEMARARLVPLTAEEYVSVVSSTAARGLRGGMIYDALICKAARKVKAPIVTFNVKHFSLLVADPAKDLVDPIA